MQKRAETTCDLIGNKITEKVTSQSKAHSKIQFYAWKNKRI